MILVQTVYFYFSYGFPIFFKIQFTSNLIFFPNWSLVYDKKKTNKKHYWHSDLLLILYVRLHHYKESFLFYICSYIIPSFTLCWRDLFSNLANHRTLWHLLLIIILCGSHIGCKIRMKWRFFLNHPLIIPTEIWFWGDFFIFQPFLHPQGLWGFVITKGNYIFQRQFIENTCVPVKFIFKWPSGTGTSEVFSNSHINFGQYIYNSNSKNMSHRLYFLKSKTIGHCICFWEKSWFQSTKILKDCYKFGARLLVTSSVRRSTFSKNKNKIWITHTCCV